MYKIITDGSCDLSTERAQELDVSVVPFMYQQMGLIIKRKLLNWVSVISINL